jgi:hypothetical protein
VELPNADPATLLVVPAVWAGLGLTAALAALEHAPARRTIATIDGAKTHLLHTLVYDELTIRDC